LAQASKTVCFTSASFQEGSTTIACATAQAAAAFGRKVLYCDFGNYNTSLSKKWHVIYQEAPDNVLDQACDSIKYVEELGFFIMPLPGPRPYDTSLIEKKDLAPFFDKLKQDYDLIIIDCNNFNKYQPYALSTRYLCEVADAAVFIILSGGVTKDNIQDTVEEMRRSGAKLIGCVMNDVNYPRLLDELCKATKHLNKFFPKFAESLRKKLRKSVVLNIES
jgi:Mrp family chromosome partitioning ATPase